MQLCKEMQKNHLRLIIKFNLLSVRKDRHWKVLEKYQTLRIEKDSKISVKKLDLLMKKRSSVLFQISFKLYE